MRLNFSVSSSETASVESQVIDALARGLWEREAHFDPDDHSDNDDTTQDDFGNDLTTGEFASLWSLRDVERVPPVFRKRALAIFELFDGMAPAFACRHVTVCDMGLDVGEMTHWRLVGGCVFGGRVVELTVFVSLWDGKADVGDEPLRVIVLS